MRLFRSGSTAQSIREVQVIGLGLLLIWQGVAQAFGWYFPLATQLFDSLPALGSLIFLAGVSIVGSAIVTMGSSWQMGFDQELRPPRLVTTGLFRFSRNPIYLGLVTALLGWFLLIPSWLWLIMLVGVAIGVRRQAIREEEYLLRTFGERFTQWARATGRFVPGIGRLR